MILVEITAVPSQWYFGGVPVRIRSANGSRVFLEEPACDQWWAGGVEVEADLTHQPGGEHWRAVFRRDNPDELLLRRFAEAWVGNDAAACAFWGAIQETITG